MCEDIKFAVDRGNSHQDKAQQVGKGGTYYIIQNLKMKCFFTREVDKRKVEKLEKLQAKHMKLQRKGQTLLFSQIFSHKTIGDNRAKSSIDQEVQNLSERVSKRIHTLKERIPDCNKIDKASTLDDAIDYHNVNGERTLHAIGALMMFNFHQSYSTTCTVVNHQFFQSRCLTCSSNQ
ncbi:hypothetical protein HN51_016626 [Arachis hypogaea]